MIRAYTHHKKGRGLCSMQVKRADPLTFPTTNPPCSVLRVEGCVPACPTPKVLDEVTQRCVYVEDCEWPAFLIPPSDSL